MNEQKSLVNSVLSKLKSIRGANGDGQKSPNKLVFLLTIVNLYEELPNRENRFPFNADLEEKFKKTWLQLFPETEERAIFVASPFYHLSKNKIWLLKIKNGEESSFREYENTPNIRITNGMLIKTVEFGYLSQELDACLREQNCRKIINEFLLNEFELLKRSDKEVGDKNERKSISLYRHEADAITAIKKRISSHTLGFTLQNLEIHDPQSKRYFETDLILIAPFGIYIVELKHWSGDIVIRPNSWVQNNSFFKGDPHKSNNFKAKLVRGIYERRFPSLPSIYFESVVILTNPEANVEGSSIPASAEHNPTFDSIDRFIKFLVIQQKKKRKILSVEQCKIFVEYLRKLHTTEKPRDFQFPGYEIVERLYQDPERAEIVARRTDIRHRRLSRLRIFFPPSVTNKNEQGRFHERATATLNAVAKTGDHPNILKVWSVPNENNYIVEGSDWSETGTLRDVIDKDKLLSLNRAITIFLGILQGLEVIHQKYVVHRSLCPENILILQDIPKLMNFDLSYQLEENRITVIPDITKLQRNPYTAPEIYKGKITPEATADLFSAGVILYEMLTGETPFGCSTDLEHISGNLKDEHKQKLREKTVPQPIEDLLYDLIKLNPEERSAQASNIIKRILKKEEKVLDPEDTNVELKSGEQSGLYQIENLLKCGAASQIYRAWGAHARQVAIKLFNVDVPLQHILDEQKFAAAVNFPSIVKVDNYNRWEGDRFYISFDWVSEKNLRDEIEKGERPDIDRFTNVAFQIIDAVQVLHNYVEDGEPKPIVHNDIKPENILLTEGDRAVLIDFGSASHPHVGIYQGTEGYVAPDLKLGQDRKYCEDGDLFALGITLFEWLCACNSVEDIEKAGVSQNLPPSLLDWLNTATARESNIRFSSGKEMRRALEKALVIIQEESDVREQKREEKQEVLDEYQYVDETLERIQFEPKNGLYRNSFVAYLNSLHSRGAGCENALAESQARNEFFGLIHIPHPITNTIQQILMGEEKQHVILTGHAGDGKSTIATELYKRMKGLEIEKPLTEDLVPRVDLEIDGNNISIVKDFSEWSSDERASLIDEMVNRKNWQFLLITNTGTLLDAFRDHEKKAGGDWVSIESDILQKIDAAEPTEMKYHDGTFSIINLSMTENLEIARQIFQRMIEPNRWEKCRLQDCHEKCPIFRNVELLHQNKEIVFERIFLAYQCMYEYGTRFTLRQLSAHLAYMITSGLSYQNIVNMSQKAAPPLITEFMFFNRFFGDNGKEADTPALQLRVVNMIREKGFSSRPCPSWE